MNHFNKIALPGFFEESFSRFLLRELRSDHAGETGAVFICRGVLAASRDSTVRLFTQDHLATEIQHLNFFEQWLSPSQHSNLIFLWKLSGFFLVALSVLMGKRMLFLTIAAVETFVVKHYAKQISYLQSQGNRQEKDLLPILVQFQAEEQNHRKDAESRLKHAGFLAKLWCSLGALGSALAVTVLWLKEYRSMTEEKRKTDPLSFNTGLYWFTNDLRVEDNHALLKAAETTQQLLCVYTVDPAWFTPNRYGQKSMGDHRWQFLHGSLVDLEQSLKSLRQRLLIVYEAPLDALAKLISQYNIDAVFRSQNAGFYENRQWRLLQQRYQMLYFEEVATHTIFSEPSLPFSLEDLPTSFSKFRKLVEHLTDDGIISTARSLPSPPKGLRWLPPKSPPTRVEQKVAMFKGSTSQAKKHLLNYFSSRLPSSYKKVRNSLDGWENSSKFSPWLANGSVSVRQILRALQNYEAKVETNESTYWIGFELLWREYFQWVAHSHSAQLFSQGGVKQKKILTSFYPERFQRWCQGNTPFPLTNACMKQLNATGYMSNRGRQIVASYFVNELNLDWRYGAAYFEQQLVDYDVASNWGNWQYLAGVGADPRGKRHFDIDKQTACYDPDKLFITKWHGETHEKMLDSVDAADWPIIDSKN